MEPRGFGLSNAEEAVLELNGMIEVQKNPEGGTVFTVYLPKNLQGDEKFAWDKSTDCGR
jgi:CitB family two-component system sensor histidine kinase CitS